MEKIFITATIWLFLAMFSTILANHFRISIALVEICIGVAAGAVFYGFGKPDMLGTNQEWVKFLASSGAILLTFLAGAELDPQILRVKLKEVSVIGLIGFFAPFFGCAALAYYVLGWDIRASLLSGVALSTTSMAVVYAVMLETGLNNTEFGKGVLGACFVNDLGTVIALGLLFAPFTYKTFIFVIVCSAFLILLPYLTHLITRLYAYKTAAVRTKWVLLTLFGLGALALWSDTEPVLPAYIAGMALAGTTAKDVVWIRRLRTLTVGFLTPFYFIRAGTLVSLMSLIKSSPVIFFVLFGGKVFSKIFGLFPFIRLFRKGYREQWYYTLLMSTGLTFGTISALFGFTKGIITQQQYSFLVFSVIASAVIPTIIANAAFLPHHLIPKEPTEELEMIGLGKPVQPEPEEEGLDEE
ncbi:MAG: cation:proton antiporter [Syntrophorhabdaceae bacterium]|nr:cation:proton antiporter [Syntrophorhabdaceae bacterium]